MARAYSLDLRERVVGGGKGGPVLPVGGQDVHGHVASVVKETNDSASSVQSGCAENGRPPALPRGERDWVLARDRREAGSHAASSA